MTTQSDLSLVWASGGGQTDPGPDKYALGWEAEIPTFQNFNYVLANCTKNILVGAEQGSYTWDTNVSYKKGVTVYKGGVTYTAISDNTGQDPATDVSHSYWTTGAILSSSSNWGLSYKDGFKLGTVNIRSSDNVWGGNDITIQNGAPNVFFRTASGSNKNWLLGNISGEMVLVDVGTTNVPDDRDISLSASTTYKLYHEGNKPNQVDVSGTIPDAPADGTIYGRRSGNWIKVTSTTVSTAPPPPLSGSGAGWYNLDDGTTYIDIDDGDSSQWVPQSPPVLSDLATSAEVNTGTNDKSIGPAALAGSDYVKDQHYGTYSYYEDNEPDSNVSGRLSGDTTLEAGAADLHAMRMGRMVMLTGSLIVLLTDADSLPNDLSCAVQWDISTALAALGVAAIQGGNGVGQCTPDGGGADYSGFAVRVNGVAGDNKLSFVAGHCQSFPFATNFNQSTPSEARFTFSVMLDVL